jgi:hypothetical protein
MFDGEQGWTGQGVRRGLVGTGNDSHAMSSKNGMKNTMSATRIRVEEMEPESGPSRTISTESIRHKIHGTP